MDFSNISWVAVVASIVANMILGWLWYGPLFGKQWAAEIGKNMEDMEMKPALYLIPIIGSFVATFVLWNVMGATGLSGVVAAFWMWLGFSAITALTNTSFRGTSTTLWAIEQGAHLVGLLVAGILLTVL
ncbi:MAG: DUF1761 domain-containing protein [Chloroflexi bacterium]|jgi:hypothetical protein|nr:DUF1761 domain-containing protein [Chloroflexota bacterium]MBT3669695.1 DUF1761 domain-containing protein [Chloroflexota bacterium]MBT4002817.1 DUF1761 domain-containing protein [Chloroflexota bacterium]MBT4305651.1 DUF1761 domain-containing protein [Chloroflexota bacterium]MBT4533808.1 DUF1761 domain-containing protein [Chloroflexota bacterium]